MTSIYWNSFGDFLAMGTHGVYVWGSFGVTAAVLLAESLWVAKARKSTLTRLKRQLRLQKNEAGVA